MTSFTIARRSLLKRFHRLVPIRRAARSRPALANIPMAIPAKHVSDPGRTPGCPIARCERARAVPRQNAGAPVGFFTAQAAWGVLLARRPIHMRFIRGQKLSQMCLQDLIVQRTSLHGLTSILAAGQRTRDLSGKQLGCAAHRMEGRAFQEARESANRHFSGFTAISTGLDGLMHPVKKRISFREKPAREVRFMPSRSPDLPTAAAGSIRGSKPGALAWA